MNRLAPRGGESAGRSTNERFPPPDPTSENDRCDQGRPGRRATIRPPGLPGKARRARMEEVEQDSSLVDQRADQTAQHIRQTWESRSGPKLERTTWNQRASLRGGRRNHSPASGEPALKLQQVGRGGTPSWDEREVAGGRGSQVREPSNERNLYKRIKELWKRSMRKAATLILDGEERTSAKPSLEAQTAFWEPIMSSPEDLARDARPARAAGVEPLWSLWEPITIEEVRLLRPKKDTAAGPDGVGPGDWGRIPDVVKALLFNCIQCIGRCPDAILDSRTILIPKTDGAMDPALFRPLSIPSVILRHYHRVLANRVAVGVKMDRRQRAFMATDGIAQNTSLLAAVLHDAKRRLKPLHMAVLDVKKAFDTVSREAIDRAMAHKGVPPPMSEYISDLYKRAKTRIEVDGMRSEPILPTRGVRQGDPLSPVLFNMIMDQVLNSVPTTVAYPLGDTGVSALAFADDIILLASTRDGLQESLNGVATGVRQQGMELMPAKCATLSIEVDGRGKRRKVTAESPFLVDGTAVKMLTIEDEFKYLGVMFDCNGPAWRPLDIRDKLDRVSRAPIKAQMRLKVLDTYLLPRYIHTLTMGKTSHAELKAIDKLIRRAVRGWLRLPHDCPNAFIHASRDQGGLGVASLATVVPHIKRCRLEAIDQSGAFFAADLIGSEWTRKRLDWCHRASHTPARWARELHGRVDGVELRDTRKARSSYQWINDPYCTVPTADYIHYVHVRCNALPSPRETYQRSQRPPRAGSVSRWVPNQGLRKPDILAHNNEEAVILDVQVISGAANLEEASKKKRDYYHRNASLMQSVADRCSLPVEQISVEAITLTWRAIWARSSEEILRSMGCGQAVLNGLSKRVLFGSYLNFWAFNRRRRGAR
ncbi:unnamed protein product [Trichogramma brassicae]|uniref:Reverse transcriptase domain-containing protein n=1 Tax=Trichogramma brassicae TaxID=86971 RepID=A0A6H5J1V8_9HYME|nr:unnamed protein product [Trichogramma brassicae]